MAPARAAASLACALCLGLISACDEADKNAGGEPEPMPAPAPEAEVQAPKDTPPPDKAPHFNVSDKVVTTVSGQGEGPYRFTAPWHTKVMGSWADVLGPLAGREGLDYLEIGAFEGRSMLWMFENVLTDPSSRVTVVDVFMGDYEQTFDDNLAASGFADRVTKIKGPSGQVLRAMTEPRFDVIYIDGSHTADDVLADAVLAWDLLELGGLLIFDDYEWKGRVDGGQLPLELRPRLSIDAFLTAHRAELELVHRDYQVIVRKREHPCKPKDFCTPIGPYQYYWRDFELQRADGSVVELSQQEIALLEQLAHAIPIGEVELALPPGATVSPPMQQLLDRLELSVE